MESCGGIPPVESCGFRAEDVFDASVGSRRSDFLNRVRWFDSGRGTPDRRGRASRRHV